MKLHCFLLGTKPAPMQSMPRLSVLVATLIFSQAFAFPRPRPPARTSQTFGQWSVRVVRQPPRVQTSPAAELRAAVARGHVAPRVFADLPKRIRRTNVVEKHGQPGTISFSMENEFHINSVRGYGEVFRRNDMTDEKWLTLAPDVRETLVKDSSIGASDFTVLDRYQDLIDNQGFAAFGTEYKFRNKGVATFEELEAWLRFEDRVGLNGSRHGWVVCNNCEQFIHDNTRGIDGYFRFSSDLAEFETLSRGHRRRAEQPDFLPGANFFHNFHKVATQEVADLVSRELGRYDGTWTGVGDYFADKGTTKYVYGSAIRRLGDADLAFEIRSANRSADGLLRVVSTITHAMESGFTPYEPFSKAALTTKGQVDLSCIRSEHRQAVEKVAQDNEAGMMLSWALRDWAHHPVIERLGETEREAAIRKIRRATEKLGETMARENTSAESIRIAVGQWAYETELLKHFVAALPAGSRTTYERDVLSKMWPPLN